MRIEFTDEELKACFDFALNMKGKHNPNMIMNRADWEICRDDIQGKLGEVAVYKYIKRQKKSAEINSELDFTISERGKWDIADLVVNGKCISVKAIKEHSKFLLIETKRYDSNGNFCYKNNDGSVIKIDMYVLVRVAVNPEVSKQIYSAGFEGFKNKAWSWAVQKEITRTIWAEILGGITHEEFWKVKKIAPKGIRCSVKNLAAIANGCNIQDLPDKTHADLKKSQYLQQENYVISSDTNLHNIESLIWTT